MDGKEPTKPCFKCGDTLPLSAFYKHPQMADGHLNKCKECNKKDVRENYRDNREHYVEYEKTRANLPQRMALNRITTTRMRTRYPEKYKAHSAVQYALRSGQLKRKPCERCGSLRVHGHHDDYSKPLDVTWLCPKHHKERHKELDALSVRCG